jgi:hypothetical protein
LGKSRLKRATVISRFGRLYLEIAIAARVNSAARSLALSFGK